MSTPRTVSYKGVDAMERIDGTLRLYRRRGPFGLLRRQDVFHPEGEWLTAYWHPSGAVMVTLSVAAPSDADTSPSAAPSAPTEPSER